MPILSWATLFLLCFGVPRARSEKQTPLICQLLLINEDVPFDHLGRRVKRESFECLPTTEEGESDFSYPIDLPIQFQDAHKQDFIKGSFFVTIPGGEIDEERGRVVYPPSAKIAPVNFEGRRKTLDTKRELEATGERTVLVVRVKGRHVDGGRVSPVPTTDQIYEKVFGSSSGDILSLASQTDACSEGLLQYVPSIHGNISGIMEVTLPDVIEGADRTIIRNAAAARARQELGVSNMRYAADHVMFCLPPGTGTWLAIAEVSGVYSSFNDDWCLYPSALLHEFGHNLGLRHSNENNEAYTDTSGYMGKGWSIPDGPAMCYNAQNHWHLGWFPDRRFEWSGQGSASQQIEVAAFTDSHWTSPTQYVLVKTGNLYMQYNRAVGFNRGTDEKRNQLVIVEDQGDSTNLLAALDLKNRLFETSAYTAGSSSNSFVLTVYVCARIDGDESSPERFVVSVSLGGPSCDIDSPSVGPSTAPAGTPSSFPTTSKRPSAFPTVTPTFTPSRSPSSAPTSAPSKTPSSAPSFSPSRTPSSSPTHHAPSTTPTSLPSPSPTLSPSRFPTSFPTKSLFPSSSPAPSQKPSAHPSAFPTLHPSASPSLSLVPSVSPTARPSAPPSIRDVGQLCDDIVTASFFVNDTVSQEEIHEYKKCDWLAARPQWQAVLCHPDHDAYIVCPETCGACVDSCEDDSYAWFNVNGASRDCAWLSLRPHFWDNECQPMNAAFYFCPETCNTCNLL